MDCHKVREIVFLYTDNEMEEELRITFCRHLELCPRCARRIEAAQRLLELVRQRCSRAVAPPRLRRRILTSLPHRRELH
ncbi:MAG: zf-HC2 domain-containing protein [Thermoanaerobaculia bacterium]|nr:zf-HC2 domain-containing protein [Thermoanaerobaculia bacterium]